MYSSSQIKKQTNKQTTSPVNKKPAETKQLFIPPHDLLGGFPGTGICDVVKMWDWTGPVLILQDTVIFKDFKTRQKWPFIFRSVNQRMADIPYNWLNHRICDDTTLVLHYRGWYKEVASNMSQILERLFHILHLETHVADSVHRVMRADIVQVFPCTAFSHLHQVLVWKTCVARHLFIQIHTVLSSLVHEKNCSCFPEGQLPWPICLSSCKQTEFEFGDKVIG